MSSFIVICITTSLLILYGIVEYQRHQRNLKSIPIRIHVNGTRGKSSVTRLIGAGLRAGGYKTITKVTGTFPRMILSDGTEVAVHRKQGANILEQLNIVEFCAKQKADVLLIECMALQPNYQKITERQMIKATHGVITNIRLDHLDVMGPTLMDVGKALSGTVPKRTKLFSAEDRLGKFLKKKADKANTELFLADKTTVSAEEMAGFPYIEHADNVALALDLCMDLGVPREAALAAMYETIPDEGALKEFTYENEAYQMNFYNALAANDPESSKVIWNNVEQQHGSDAEFVVLFNSRKDRKSRSEEMIAFISELSFDFLALTGESIDLVQGMALKNNIAKDKIILIGERHPQEQLDCIGSKVNKKSVVVAMGNMGAGGAELSNYVEQNQLAS